MWTAAEASALQRSSRMSNQVFAGHLGGAVRRHLLAQAETSWACTDDRAARTRPAGETFLKRFEKEVAPDGTLPPEERRQRVGHAKRAYMLKLAKRSAAARRAR